MRKKNKRADRRQRSHFLPPSIEQIDRRAKVINRLDIELIIHFGFLSESLEPVGPLAGKKRSITIGPPLDKPLDHADE